MLFSHLAAQDTLITMGGRVYVGRFGGATEKVVYFFQDGQVEAAAVPKIRISKIILEDGTVAFDQSKMLKSAPVVQHQPISESDISSEIGIETVNDYERRQTEALEIIAKSTTGIYYLMIVGTAVAILTYIKYLEAAGNT